MASAVSSIAVICWKPEIDGIGVKSSTANGSTQCVRLPVLSRNRASDNRVVERKNLCSGGRRGSDMVVVMATGESADPGIDVNDLLKSVQEVWDGLDDKYAVVGLGFAAIIALWGSTGLIGAIDKLPIVPSLLELVGIGYSGWFVYRNLLFKPDREELLEKIQNNLGEILGNK